MIIPIIWYVGKMIYELLNLFRLWMKLKITEIQNNINPKYYKIYNEIIKDACENMGIKNVNASWINVEYEEDLE